MHHMLASVRSKIAALIMRLSEEQCFHICDSMVQMSELEMFSGAEVGAKTVSTPWSSLVFKFFKALRCVWTHCPAGV